MKTAETAFKNIHEAARSRICVADCQCLPHNSSMRNIIFALFITWAVGLLSACGEADIKNYTGKDAVDVLYVNGNIWTGSSTAPNAESFAVKDGKIFFVGESKTQRANQMAKETIDLGGRFVMPGFIDNHVHFMEGGAALSSVDLRDAKTPEEFSKRIIEYAKTRPKGAWVLNGNWDHELWGGELPHKSWIDAHTKDVPVYVIRLDGHMALANSAALRLAGIDKNTKAPEGGEIQRGPNGEPTGLLKDNALNIVLSIIPPPSDEELMEQFSNAQSHAFSLGLTKVHAVTGYPTETTMRDIFEMARDRDIMKIRAFVSTPIEDWENGLKAMQARGRGDELLGLGGIKGLIDGSLGSGTAWFYQPYSDEPDNSGFPIVKPEEFADWMRAVDSAGMPLSIHAIGDKAIDTAIAAMRDIAGEDVASRRYRIEHFQHPNAAAITAIAESGIIASMQPYHAIDDGRWAQGRIGAVRAKTTYGFRSILDAGGILTFGSDWPVAPLSPIEGVYAAVTRRTTDGANPDGWIPEQKITAEQAMTAYTVANAFAMGEEDVAGTIEAGKRADFVVLSDDPRAVAPEFIQNIKVLRTVIGGETVFERDGE